MIEGKNIEDCCFWLKSDSIHPKSLFYKSCHEECDGFNKDCIGYEARKLYFQRKARMLKYSKGGNVE